jgi:hypothetical protein
MIVVDDLNAVFHTRCQARFGLVQRVRALGNCVLYP